LRQGRIDPCDVLIERAMPPLVIARSALNASASAKLSLRSRRILAPSFIGPRLQLVSYLGSRRSRLLAAAEPTNKEVAKALGSFERLLTSVIDKARISPLGEHFYNVVYSELSWFAHQAYGVLEQEALGFEDVVSSEDDDLVRYLPMWLNVITTALLARVGNEVGYRVVPAHAD
jgi:hypothetical protein